MALKRKRSDPSPPRSLYSLSPDRASPEQDAWHGFGDTQPAPGTRPKKPPTGEELRQIKDAADLYRSSSFKLQIDALIPNIRPKYHKSSPLDKYLLSLHPFLESLPSISPKNPLVAARELSKSIAVPYPLPAPTESTNWKVAFEKPAELLLVGSWPNKTNVKEKDGARYGVDVALVMPQNLFQEKDYLDSRFFHKRAYYLAVIAAAILDHPSLSADVELLYESILGDPRLTTLVLAPKQTKSPTEFSKLNAQIRLIPILPQSSPFPLQRLAPSRSNLRVSASDDSTQDASPIYNTLILQSFTPRHQLLSVHALKESSPAFADALALLRVWANQRGYGTGSRLSVRGFEGKGVWWAELLKMLVVGEEPTVGFAKSKGKRKPLGTGLSSYQMFKAALDFLARHNFESEKVFVRSKDGHRFPPEEYSNHDAVFVDSSSTVNLLAGVPLCSLEMLKHDAQLSLQTLNRTMAENSFDEIFLKDQRDVLTRFDVVMRVNLASAKPRKPSAHATLDHGSAYNALLSSIFTILRQGLGNRIKTMAVLHSSLQLRPISQANPANPSVIYIGLILDTEFAFRLVDHGPPAQEEESEAARQFRELWGEKAELRRFKDGSIVESVVWEVATAEERAHIPARIVRCLLGRHCGLQDEAVITLQEQFDTVLRLPPSIAKLYQASATPAGYKAAMAAFDNLVKAIKALDEKLPLAVLNVSPVAEALRYTSVMAPVPLPAASVSTFPPSARYAPPMDIIVEFEKSARWPDDLRAIQKIKLAFLAELATCLMASVKGLRADIVVGDGVTANDVQDQAALEIRTPEGWTFNARIWHDREATLLDRILDDRSRVPKHLRPDADAAAKHAALAAREVYTRRFVHAPRHHRAVAALAHRFPAYAGTVRLAKRWLAAHWLLRGHVGEEAVELLCAKVFLDRDAAGAGAGVPGTKERGFALVVELLKDWRWEGGMHVPLYGEQEAQAVDVVAGKAGAWVIQTEQDPSGRMWTAQGPDAVVARRAQRLAKATWECLRTFEGGTLSVKALFAHPAEDYDFVIELDRGVLPRYGQNVDADPAVWTKGKYANLPADQADAGFAPGSDPAQLFFDDLKRVYRDTLKLFFDPIGGCRIGAVWDPSLKEPRPFRVLGGYSSAPVTKDDEKSKDKDKSLVSLNEAAVLSEIERLGAGLIAKIVLHV